jgi:hypothetical protein
VVTVAEGPYRPAVVELLDNPDAGGGSDVRTLQDLQDGVPPTALSAQPALHRESRCARFQPGSITLGCAVRLVAHAPPRHGTWQLVRRRSDGGAVLVGGRPACSSSGDTSIVRLASDVDDRRRVSPLKEAAVGASRGAVGASPRSRRTSRR